jgi:hypothetical protein
MQRAGARSPDCVRVRFVKSDCFFGTGRIGRCTARCRWHTGNAGSRSKSESHLAGNVIPMPRDESNKLECRLMRNVVPKPRDEANKLSSRLMGNVIPKPRDEAEKHSSRLLGNVIPKPRDEAKDLPSTRPNGYSWPSTSAQAPRLARTKNSADSPRRLRSPIVASAITCFLAATQPHSNLSRHPYLVRSPFGQYP